MKAIESISDPRYVKAMSHPLRVRIIALLDEREASPVELAEILDANLGVMAYHVRTLEKLGLVELVGEARRRGAVQHFYRSTKRPAVTNEAWSQASAIVKQAAVGSSLQMIDEYARASAAAGGFDRSDAALIRLSLKLDDEGWKELAGAYAEFFARIQQIEASAEPRLKRTPHADGTIDAGVVLMVFEAVKLGQALSPTAGAGSTKRTRKRPPRRLADQGIE